MKTRIWVRSGIEEEFDIRQQRLIELVMSKIEFYYCDLYQTQTRYQHPLSLTHLMKLTKRNSYAVVGAIRVLANTIEKGGEEPRVFYDRTKSDRNRAHRPYRIFLRKRN